MKQVDGGLGVLIGDEVAQVALGVSRCESMQHDTQLSLSRSMNPKGESIYRIIVSSVRAVIGSVRARSRSEEETRVRRSAYLPFRTVTLQ